MSLVEAMAAIVTLFQKYSKGQPTMTKGQVAKLLRHEFGGNGDTAEAEEIFKALDADGSGTIDFKEFVTFVATLTASVKVEG